jgi:hypothetical protein
VSVSGLVVAIKPMERVRLAAAAMIAIGFMRRSDGLGRCVADESVLMAHSNHRRR